MPIDRVGNRRLTPLNPEERYFADDRGDENVSGKKLLEQGYSTLDRANQHGYFNRNRRGLTSPVEGEPNSDYGDETYGRIVY
jgi:hypothetical protein